MDIENQMENKACRIKKWYDEYVHECNPFHLDRQSVILVENVFFSSSSFYAAFNFILIFL